MDCSELELTELRKHLDKLDNSIIDRLVKRFKITQTVGEYKKKHNLPSLDASREEAIYARFEKIAVEKEISPELLKGIWQLIITESKKNHEVIKNN